INRAPCVLRRETYTLMGINYLVSQENAKCLAAAAIDCCVLANNHVLEWGRTCLSDTLATLSQLGIKTAGAGRNLDEAQAPALLDFHLKGRVLVYSFAFPCSGVPHSWAATQASPGVNVLGDHRLAGIAHISEPIGRRRQPGDVLVASFR